MTSKKELLVWYPNETVTSYRLIKSSLHTRTVSILRKMSTYVSKTLMQSPMLISRCRYH